MLALIDRLTATKADHACAKLWARIAIERFGDGAVDQLRLGLRRDAAVRSRRVVRLAIRRASRSSRTAIFITTIAAPDR